MHYDEGMETFVVVAGETKLPGGGVHQETRPASYAELTEELLRYAPSASTTGEWQEIPARITPEVWAAEAHSRGEMVFRPVRTLDSQVNSLQQQMLEAEENIRRVRRFPGR